VNADFFLVKVEKEREANRQVLLRPSAEDRLAMAIIAAKDPTQHALFDDISPQPPMAPTSPHEGPQNGLLDTPATTEGSDFLGDSFSPESVSPRRSKQRASYQSVQSCASHDSTSTGIRPSDTHPDPYQSGISIYLPGSKGTRWVHTDARFDTQSDDSHISPNELRELGIDVSLDLTVSRALQRLGIMIPRNLVAPTSYSAMGSSGGIVPAQGRIKLTWKAHMGRGYHTNDFFVGPDSAPYGVLIGKDFLVPATGEPRMKLSLPNYRNRKDEGKTPTTLSVYVYKSDKWQMKDGKRNVREGDIKGTWPRTKRISNFTPRRNTLVAFLWPGHRCNSRPVPHLNPIQGTNNYHHKPNHSCNPLHTSSTFPQHLITCIINHNTP
jgi:hypothetical protein